MAEIITVEIVEEKGIPTIKCPTCGKTFRGYALIAKIGEEEICECKQKMKLILKKQ